MKYISAEQINAVLPQTQCGLCGFKGCFPYAEALSNGTANINLCPPGGIKGLLLLADLLQQDAAPYIENMTQKLPSKVVIREDECIGCTKCIKACPVDAIIGTNKQMHTVILDACTGCELCIPACPVDCIDIIPSNELTVEEKRLSQSNFEKKQKRLSQLDIKPKFQGIEERRKHLQFLLKKQGS